MGIVENIKWLCRKRDTSIPKIEKELRFGNGAIYNWDKNSPTIGKLQQVADYLDISVEFLNLGFDREIIDIIKSLTEIDKGRPIFPTNTSEILAFELENVKKEYWDVPLVLDPSEMILLIKQTPLSTEFKEAFLNALNRVKQSLDSSSDSLHINTLAAHKTDGYKDDLTEEEQRVVRAFIETYRKQFKKNE